MAFGDGLRALVLEDDEAIQRLIVRVLGAHGFAVEAVDDGLQGLLKLEEWLPDIIICDVMMPNLDGLAFTKAIKRYGGTRQIPVVFVTARGDVDSVVEGMRAGAAHYLSKPFLRDDLVSKIKAALRAPPLTSSG